MPTILPDRKDTPAAAPGGRQLTGRAVLLWLIGFFGLVFLVNIVMVRAAVSTFGGVQTESSYKAGLSFMRDVAASEAQDALGWKVDAALSPSARGEEIVVRATDRNGRPLSGLAARIELRHPADARADRHLTVVEREPGVYVGTGDALHGQWDLNIVLMRGDEPEFRSMSRIVVR